MRGVSLEWSTSLTESTPPIRLLACDMDGTLFRQDLVISERVQRAIATAQRAGVVVALATGRMPAAARSFVEMLSLSGPQIYSNGALVQTPDGEVLHHRPIDPEVAPRVVVYGRGRGVHVKAYLGDDVFVERMGPEAEFTRALNRLNPQLVPDLATFVEQGPTKMVLVRLPEAGPSLVAEVQAAFPRQVTAFSSVKQYCEIIHPDADKGKALRALAERLSIPIEQVAAIGDGDNDLTLLGAAGLPLAMGNGTTRLKAIARHVVGTVEEDGVAEAIETYILGK